MQIRNAQDFWSGILFAAFGLFFIVFAREYDMGSAARMGPAYFPTVLGGLLLALGVLISGRAMALQSDDGRVDHFHFKPLLLVLGAVVAFGLLLRPGGLFVALAALVIISSFGSDQFRLRDVLLLTLFLALLVYGVFIFGLGLTVPVLPAFMSD
jgi:putative tricarboxylic transport membrane protein